MDNASGLITFLAAMNVVDAVVFIALAIPLILRKVPMNGIYGARFSQSFKSEKNWYDINAASGKLLLGCALLMFITGLYGFFTPEISAGAYTNLTLLVTLGSVGVACILSYIVARKIDKRNHV